MVTRHGTCRLQLIINDVTYTVTPLCNDENSKLYMLKNNKNGKTYTTGVNNIGRICNCPDNTRRSPMGGCKHIKALLAMMMM